MVIRQDALMGHPGFVYVLCSGVASLFGGLGVAYHCDVLVWIAMFAMFVSFLLGWIIDQERWWMPVVVSNLDGMSRHERIRSRIYCGLAFLARCMALGICVVWFTRLLQVAATGAPF